MNESGLRVSMSTSSEKYETLQDEVDSLLQRIQEAIGKTEAAAGDEKKKLAQSCSSMFGEVTSNLDTMDTEARAAPLQFRASMVAQVRRYRAEVSSLQTSLNRARVERMTSSLGASSEARQSNSAGTGGGAVTDQYRQQVLAGTEILSRTGESLSRAQQVAIETDEVGNVIITDLGTQRETLERTRARLGEAGEDLSRSRRVLRRMYTNVVSNKIILIVIILVEIGILAGVTYWKYIKK